MENNERLNEINNSEVEKLLIGKMQDIFGENKTRYFNEGINLDGISVSNVDGKVVYEVMERDAYGFDRRSYYGGDGKLIFTDSSKFGLPVFATKGWEKRLQKNLKKLIDSKMLMKIMINYRIGILIKINMTKLQLMLLLKILTQILRILMLQNMM